MANSGAACKAAAGICVYGNISGTPTRLRSTIIANNTNTADATASADLYSTQPLSGASNLIVSANVTPPGTLGGDPQLGPLVDNGGGTLTHALAPTSPAIDAGDPNGWSTDQRSKPRVAGGAADIGAYELQVNDVIFRNGFD